MIINGENRMDNHTSEQRRKNMQAVKNKDSQIELILRRELWIRNLRYRKNVNSVYGKPDIAFIRKKVAVFCDSEFWHGYDWENRKNQIKTHRDFWIPKIERNIERDKDVNMRLESDGWIVIRFWGNEIKKTPQQCAERIQAVLEGRK